LCVCVCVCVCVLCLSVRNAGVLWMSKQIELASGVKITTED